ncbi:MAG: ATP-binding protein [Prevotella sp.]|nr:ATP-binding protein [Prevotella sp.]
MSRKYPIGIQTFERIIRNSYLYIDKTDLVWKLQQYSTFVFLSRPRRFGKSLLSSTLHSYFDGDRELFEGLKIMQLEQEWHQYPVIHIDLSVAKGQQSADELRHALSYIIEPYEQMFGANASEQTPGQKLSGLIRRAYQHTGQQAAVIIDEYDAPLLEVLHKSEMLDDMRRVMQEFYQPLKACEPYIKFCFITGITKFSQLSIFSTLNNLTNVTMLPAFSAICGITEQELTECMGEDIRLMAEEYECTPEEMHAKLKLRYDGYHFSEKSPEVYNPFSLLNALRDKKLDNYWFSTGTPTFLIRQMQHFRTDITGMDDIEAPATSFDVPTEAMTTALPLLYQSGYLTIKGYDRDAQMYALSIPNQEVRIGFVQGLLPTYTGLGGGDVQAGFALKFWRALKKNDINLAMHEMQAYLASIPYVEGFKKKLEDAATAEGFYEYTLYLIFSMLNVYVRTQVKVSTGRIDMVVYIPDTIYVFELKVHGAARQALEQIDSRGYAIPYQADGRRVVKVGIHFSIEKRTLDEWEIANAPQ